jgi:hypothetical protein
VGFGQMTPREKTCRRTMAELGEGPYQTGDIADMLGDCLAAASVSWACAGD